MHLLPKCGCRRILEAIPDLFDGPDHLVCGPCGMEPAGCRCQPLPRPKTTGVFDKRAKT